MVSKNNLVNHLKFKSDNKQRFAIKKFTVGAASVLIGTTLYAGSMVVNADETNTTTDSAVESVVDTTTNDSDKDKSDEDSSSESTVSENSNETSVVNDSNDTEDVESKDATSETVENNDTNTVNKDVTKSATTDAVDVNNSSSSDVEKTDSTTNENPVQSDVASVSDTVNAINANSNEENREPVTNNVDSKLESTTDGVNNTNSVLRSADQNNEVSDDVNKNSVVENKVGDKQELGTINVYAYTGYSILVPEDDKLSHEPLLKIPYYSGVDNVVDLEPYRAQLAKVMSDRVMAYYKYQASMDESDNEFTVEYNKFLDFLKSNPNYLSDQFVFVDSNGNKVSYFDPNSYKDGQFSLYLDRLGYNDILDPGFLAGDNIDATGSNFLALQDVINKDLNININTNENQSFVLDVSNIPGDVLTDTSGTFIPLQPDKNLSIYSGEISSLNQIGLAVAGGISPYRPTSGNIILDENSFDLVMNEVYIPINVTSSVDSIKSGKYYLNSTSLVQLLLNGSVQTDASNVLDILTYLRDMNITVSVPSSEPNNQYLPISNAIVNGLKDKFQDVDDLNNNNSFSEIYSSDEYQSVYNDELQKAQDIWAEDSNTNFYTNDSLVNTGGSSFIYYVPFYDENDKIVPGKYVGLLSFMSDPESSHKYNVVYKPIDPTYKGYVDNLYRVSAAGSSGGTSGFNTIVLHQNGIEDVTFVDVGTSENPINKELSKLTGEGETGTKVNFDVDAQIKYYESLGYKVVANNYDPNANYNLTPRHFVVELQHNTESVSETKDVTRTIHYVAKADPTKTLAPDSVQTLTFTRTGTKDLVTGEVTWNEWSPEQSFDPVKSPDVENYRPETANVAAQIVGYDSNNIDVTVPYVTKGSITVDFIDDETGKIVGTFSYEGFPGDDSIIDQEVDADFNANIDRLLQVEHYELAESEISNEHVDQKYRAFADVGFVENEDRKLEIHLVHQKKHVDEAGSRNILWNFKYKDTDADVKEPDFEQVNYVRQGTTDLVTGVTTYEPIYLLDSNSQITTTELTPDYVLGSSLKLPVVPGYSTYVPQWVLDLINGVSSKDETLVKVDKFPAVNLLTANRVFNGDDNLMTVDTENPIWGPITIYYVKDDQKINVKYIDDSTGQELHADSLVGKSEESSGYTTADKIKELEAQGYKLVSDNTNGETLVYDNDSSVDQNYEVHLIQGSEVVSESKVVNHTIHYVNESGDPVFDDVEQSVTFKREGSKNKVTGEITWNDWTPEQTFDTVTSPVKAGYTADKPVVSDVSATHEFSDLETYVVYSPDIQHIKVTYIDDVTGAVLSVKSIDGLTGDDSGYMTAETIKNYEGQGYKLVSDSTDGKALIFDDDSDTDQEYFVHLTHATESVSDTKAVNRVIHYVDQNNNKLFDDHVDTPLEFKRTGSKDLVTGEITWNDWDTQTKEFELVVSPTKAGYTPSVKFVPSSEVTPESANIEETVVYVPNKQYVVVNYIDDTTGTVLTTDSLNGASEETLDYTTKPKITDYEGMGYELVSDETNGNPIVLDSNDEVTQIYNVHLKHGFESLSDNKTVKRTIHYVDSDGKTLVDDYVYPAKEFIRTGVKDKVTSEITWNDWSNVDAFSAMATPVVTGYVPDFAEVEAYMPKADEGDTEFTVTYTKAEQKAQITFIDDTLDKVLTTQDANGKFGDAIVFDQLDETLAGYLDAGYTLVSNDFNGQSYKADDAENNYVVHLTHGIDDVSEDKIITRTINYVDNNGNVLKDSVTQTVTLTRSGSKDKVTGEITWNEWSVGSYDVVKSPLIDGYNDPDILEVPQADVSSDDEDSVVNVVYTAVEVSIPEQPEPEEPEVPETPQPSEPEVPNVPDVEEPSGSELDTPVNEEQKPTVNTEIVTEQPVVNTTDTVVKDTTKVTSVVENKVNSPVENKTSEANDLPQMGDKENIGSAIAGFGMLGMLFGLFGYKSRKKHD